MSDLDPAVVEQMVALVRACEKVTGPYMPDDIPENARAISKLLPKPVDPDLLEARRILYGATAPYLNSDLILAGIKRGRALAQRDAER